MTRERPPLSPEVSELLDHEREIPPLPATVRARAIARARAALVAGVDRRLAPIPAPRTRWAAVAAGICILGGAVGAAAYQIRARLTPPPAPAISRPAAPAKVAVSAPPPAPVTDDARDEAPDVAPSPPARATLSKADAARAELHLLRQARSAVARGDYAAALTPIAEHAHRFKDGRLAEEREALRVKSLAGLGRTDEARRAAKAFRARFPRSVLLPAVSQMPAASEP
jgi:hypothetical protein